MHTFAAHTGEVEIHLEAPSLAELFREAGLALAEVMAGGPPPAPAPAGDAQRVELFAPDRDALLFDWLNELVFRAERDRRLYPGIAVERAGDRELVASIRPAEVPELRTLVKAATFYGLRITETPRGFAANVVLDV